MSKEQFEEAAQKIKTLEETPDDQSLLFLYAHYKQATEGDNKRAQPWAIQLKERAKWDAWNDLQGLSTEEAMKLYIDKVNSFFK